jgi:beta-N-acetylhexosaminidase
MRRTPGPTAIVVMVCASVLAACSAPDPPGAREASGAPAPAPSQWASQEPATRASAEQPPAPTESPSCVDRIPLDVRIGQTMLVTTTDIPRVQRWLDDGLIAGLMSSGVLTPQLAGALERATYGTQYGALLATDEEGGSVQRYREVVGYVPSAREQALTMTPKQVQALFRGHGEGLSDWGVDMVFAPVVDVGSGPGIGSRSYSEDPAVVSQYATAAARGYAQAGLIPVLKHFPGHGTLGGDPHDGVAAGPPIEQLRQRDLLPFAAVPGEVEVGIMVGHSTIPGYSDIPASQSPAVIQGLLIDELGFDGLIVSDALGMAATGTEDQGQALVGFLVAGGDLGIIGPGGSIQGRRAVRRALADGTLDEARLNDAAAAVLSAKGVDSCSVAGGKDPIVDDRELPPDPVVTNPSEDP